MKKTIFLTFLATVLFSMVHVSVSGQTNERQTFTRENYETRRIAYITAEISLTAAEASKFFPLENEYKLKFFEIGQDCRRLIRESQNNKKMSDAEYMKLIDCNLETRLKEAQLEKEYFEKFKQILTPEKIYKYQQADIRFAREFVIVRRPSGNQNNDRDNNNNRSRR